MWRKSSRSNTGSCVEVRHDLAALRDSKSPAGVLEIPSVAAFVAFLRDGRHFTRR
jgi:hypothetical protein